MVYLYFLHNLFPDQGRLKTNLSCRHLLHPSITGRYNKIRREYFRVVSTTGSLLFSRYAAICHLLFNNTKSDTRPCAFRHSTAYSLYYWLVMVDRQTWIEYRHQASASSRNHHNFKRNSNGRSIDRTSHHNVSIINAFWRHIYNAIFSNPCS